MYSIFSETLQRLLKSNLKSRNGSQAENTSWCSDLSNVVIHPEFLKRADSMINTIVAIAFTALNPIQEEEVRRRLFNICDKYGEGKWLLARKLILANPFSPFNVLSILVEEESPNAFFGNRIKQVERIYYLGIRFRETVVPESRVNYPQRKCGYHDKGSLPKSHYGQGDTTLGIPGKSREKTEFDINPSNSIWFSELKLAGDPFGPDHSQEVK